MKTIHLAVVASVAATPLLAQDTREMDAHVHGVSTFELAVEDGVVEMNLRSPGMDIVGFEYQASTDADKNAVEAAVRVMLVPENVVTLPKAAKCRLTETLARFHGDDDAHEEGEEHMHDAEGKNGHDHEENAEAHDHDHEKHAEGEEHDHKEAAAHSEFHARYIFACEHPEELTIIIFPFFENFGNAREIEAQYVTEAGAGAAEIDRENAQLTLNR